MPGEWPLDERTRRSVQSLIGKGREAIEFFQIEPENPIRVQFESAVERVLNAMDGPSDDAFYEAIGDSCNLLGHVFNVIAEGIRREDRDEGEPGSWLPEAGWNPTP